MKRSFTVTNRRQFFVDALPAGALSCLGCGTLLASACSRNSSQEPAAEHKFQDPSGMSYEQVFEFACRREIAVMKALAAEIGKDEFIEMLKRAASEAAAESVRKETPDLPVKGPAFLLAMLKEDDLLKHILTVEIVEGTEKAVETRVTECLWAKTVREMDAADIGYAAICHPDFAMARALNPKMKMLRTKTLMQGDECCDHRWIMEG